MIYENIKRLCEEHGVSIWKMEKDLGFSVSSISKWKYSEPSVLKVKMVAEYLQVTIEEIVKGCDTCG